VPLDPQSSADCSAGMRSEIAVRRRLTGAAEIDGDYGLAFPQVNPLSWAWLDLNQRPHPYQGSAPGLVSPGWDLRPGRTMYGWRPLETARNRSAPMACGPNVDQARSLAGAAALRIADLGWQGDPRRLPPTSDPRLAITLLGGALAGSGPGTSPYVGAVPGHRHGYPSALPVQTMRTMVGFLDDMGPRGRSVVVSRSWCAAAGEVGFEPSVSFLRRPRSGRWTAYDLRFLVADGDRSCPPRTSGSRCPADPPRTEPRGES
jgi:hypothetical protein